jgi:hypothetical protein
MLRAFCPLAGLQLISFSTTNSVLKQKTVIKHFASVLSFCRLTVDQLLDYKLSSVTQNCNQQFCERFLILQAYG